MDSKKYVLIADDDNTVLNLYESILGTLTDEHPNDLVSDELDDLSALIGVSVEESKPDVYEGDLDFYLANDGLSAVDMQDQCIEAGIVVTHALLDIRMPPGIDGIKTAKLLLEKNPSLDITFISAYSEYSEEMIAEELGRPCRVLKKPFSKEEIIEILSES
ncbi:MAG: response regulator [Gammaproteobacteria bacterium]|nr:response regulator [Gammaproteobacteria bacterium]MBT4608208.1 response regulator [Thiotrichales bacterium]MBT3472212.1 response regulator [Gammaproteobacteria bacterium]MBT3966010.1 response regulator [Gammaproteobacteria bacterium]MBT4079933.1 response regulator [Gammaproteobacteria bacterium]